MTDLREETTGNGMTTFEHFGRTWTVPTRRNARHTYFLKSEFQSGFGQWYLMVAEAFLSPAVAKANQQKPDQFAAFLDLEPDDESGAEFAAKLSEAVGFGKADEASGNS